MATGLFLPAGSANSGGFDLVVTPQTAGWGYSSLRVLTLQPGQEQQLDTDSDEMFVVPLAGSCTVTLGEQSFDLYYLNVMAGPGEQRAWLISDHPDQAWVRGSWAGQHLDPRLFGQTVTPDSSPQGEGS